MLSVLAQAATPEVSGWFGLLGLTIGATASVAAAWIANRARITANKVEEQVTPNGGSSAHDQIMQNIDGLRRQVQSAVDRDDGRFVGIERHLHRVDRRLDGFEEHLAKLTRRPGEPEP